MYKTEHQIEVDLVRAGASVSRYTSFKEPEVKDIARIIISELEYDIRERKEQLNKELNNLKLVEQRLNNAKRCLIRGRRISLMRKSKHKQIRIGI